MCLRHWGTGRPKRCSDRVLTLASAFTWRSCSTRQTFHSSKRAACVREVSSRPHRNERELEWAVLETDLEGLIAPKELERLKHMDEEAWLSAERVLDVPTYFAWGQLPQMV